MKVVFGALFVVGASLSDVAIHVTMKDSYFLSELIRPTAVMPAYRILFFVSGIGLGVLLWLKNRSERAFRQLSVSFDAFRRNVTARPCWCTPIFRCSSRSTGTVFQTTRWQ